ncbi:site-specific integrase [Longispora sp. NPDC051575]|uniref:tyrosine-type recombinase/integrase n=1 Tax=Longispora sp. NPDC051575 TaxID=3154943 RepID=UPI0034144D30
MAADPSRIAAARLVLAELGVTLDDLRHETEPRRIPTFDAYVPKVRTAASPGALRTYGSYWDRIVEAWGERRLDEIAASDVEGLQRAIVAGSTPRRNSRGGRHAGESLIAAARAIYRRAAADKLIPLSDSPAHQVVKPRRLPNVRRALTGRELEEINRVARSGGYDVVLDSLLLRLHTETACRRGGALGLRLVDLDVSRGLVRLTEKGGTQRWQPITLELARHLDTCARQRGANAPVDKLLRFRNGRPLTSRRYDALWKRIGEVLPWVAAHGVSAHWLRHTTLTWVERHFGYGVARAYAGHTDSVGPATTTYIKADVQAVATALAAMTGQPHPLSGPIASLPRFMAPSTVQHQ